MTEKTANSVQRDKHEIHWLPFFGALILAPFIVAVLGFWAIIPIFALKFGLPTYILFGAPLFALTIRLYGPSEANALFAGFVANLVSYPFVALFMGVESASLLIGFGILMAPLWGATFGWLYVTFTLEGEAF